MHCLRLFGTFLVLMWFVFAVLVLGLRWVVLPQVGAYRAEIAAELSRLSGQPVTIGALSADWSGLRPRLHLSALKMTDAEGRSVLELDRVDATLAWSSLLPWTPSFHRLEIVGPTLDIQRAADGALVVAGMRTGGGGANGGGLDWLLDQRRVVVRDATLIWRDDMRRAPALTLSGVEFLLERGLLLRRFALRAQPPAALASMLDVRGELRQFAVDRLAETVGRLYVGLERADLGAWSPWVDYPVPLSGQGGTRLWLDLDGAGGVEMQANLALESVSTTLAADLPPLHLSELHGQLSARYASTAVELTASQLALSTSDGQRLEPTDLRLSVRHADTRQPGEGQLQASLIDFAALARLAAHLPFDDGVRSRLAAFDPRGRVRDLRLTWRGEAATPESWKVSARFEDIGLSARDALPGVGGLSGEINGTEQSGRFMLAGRNTHIDLPDVMTHPRLVFASLKADGGWSRRDGRVEISLDSAGFDNADAAGTAAGKYWPEPGGVGEIDLSARLTRADGAAVWRYLPRVVNRDTHEWVRNAIRRATVPEARLRLKGRLEDFPFRDGNGQFLVAIKVAKGRLEYAPDWPPIEDIDGEVRFEGPGMRIEAVRGRIFGVLLSKVSAVVPDLDVQPSEVMTLTGRAAGTTSDFLRFVSESPVSRRIDGFTDGMRAEGNGTLDLKLVMPLRSVVDTEVVGSYRFSGNRLWVVEGLPALEQAAGSLAFTADELRIPEARARLFGEPVKLVANTAADGGVKFTVNGGIDMQAARAHLELPVLAHLSGRSGWGAEIGVDRSGTQVRIRASLEGVSSSLPHPFNKGAGESWPLEFDLAYPAGGGGRSVRFSLSDRLAGALVRRPGEAGYHGGVGVFQPVRLADKGVMVAAKLDHIDADAWRRILDESSQDAPATGKISDGGLALELAGVALEAGKVQLFGQALNALNLRALADAGGWRARLDSREAKGEFDWRRAGDGNIHARLSHLTLAESDDDAGRQGAEPATDAPPRSLPGLDVVIDKLVLGERTLGRLDVLARNRDGSWHLERFALRHPEGSLSGSGVWQTRGSARTELDFVLTTPNVGRLVEAMGHGEALRGGKATLAGKLRWRGAPTRIDYPTLTGQLDLDAEAGQFRQLDPGVGRLLGVLSLQALPRRISLDFRDVFSEGFAFDRISGSIEVTAGVMRTEALEIRGPAARVLMRGQADIAAETQDLRVTVQPTLSESVAIGAAAGLINPVAGVVTYLAQKALSDPIEKLFAFEYAVTGRWSDPVVEKLGSPAGQLIPGVGGADKSKP
ncbi:YhdP family protein [Parazoarcus communis]|nr:YhdP family protein [Parazoarcus communis]